MTATDARVSRTDTNDSDIYDHAIKLVDSTASNELPESDNSSSKSHQKNSRWQDIGKTPAKQRVKGSLAKRKLAKQPKERDEGIQQPAEHGEPSAVPEELSQAEAAEVLPGKVAPLHRVEETDFAARKTSEELGRSTTTEEQQLRMKYKDTRKTKAHKKKEHRKNHHIDILYENQRGWFVFGLPMYSHSSLLNFDPAAWVTKDFKDSPVNITNAQLPDPSWEWEWTSWYVDMSYDVDEEGWQYSFSFSSRSSWHGTHPWFHSFVRRRRWLRQRVMKHHRLQKDAQPSHMSQAHMLTSDYFTIHPKRDQSPSTDLDTNARYSYVSTSTAGTADDLNIPPEDINNIPSLMKALKLATVDREKIDAVRRFVEQGGEELAYLKDSIPDIMSFLVFQNSRRQLVTYLHTAAHDAECTQAPSESDQPDETRSQRAEHLKSAAEAANLQISGLEYWSDRKHVLSTTDDLEHHDDPAVGEQEIRPGTAASKDSKATFISREAHETRIGNPMKQDEIKGIPKEAGVGVDPTKKFLKMGSGLQSSEGDAKGKARAVAVDGANDNDEQVEKTAVDDDEQAKDEGAEIEEESRVKQGEEEEGKPEQPANELLPRDAVRMVEQEESQHHDEDDDGDNDGDDDNGTGNGDAADH